MMIAIRAHRIAWLCIIASAIDPMINDDCPEAAERCWE
jgi:hypothetical protein